MAAKAGADSEPMAAVADRQARRREQRFSGSGSIFVSCDRRFGRQSRAARQRGEATATSLASAAGSLRHRARGRPEATAARSWAVRSAAGGAGGDASARERRPTSGSGTPPLFGKCSRYWW